MSTDVYTRLSHEECPKCGIVFGVSETFLEKKNENGGNWFCPNGHSIVFCLSRAEELRQKLEAEKQNTQFWRDRADRVDKSRAAIKGQLTKVKKRVANGVCPCCNRSFENLERHMTTKHPDFSGAEK